MRALFSSDHMSLARPRLSYLLSRHAASKATNRLPTDEGSVRNRPRQSLGAGAGCAIFRRRHAGQLCEPPPRSSCRWCQQRAWGAHRVRHRGERRRGKHQQSADAVDALLGHPCRRRCAEVVLHASEIGRLLPASAGEAASEGESALAADMRAHAAGQALRRASAGSSATRGSRAARALAGLRGCCVASRPVHVAACAILRTSCILSPESRARFRCKRSRVGAPLMPPSRALAAGALAVCCACGSRQGSSPSRPGLGSLCNAPYMSNPLTLSLRRAHGYGAVGG